MEAKTKSFDDFGDVDQVYFSEIEMRVNLNSSQVMFSSEFITGKWTPPKLDMILFVEV